MRIQIVLSADLDKELCDLVEVINTWVYKGHASKYSALGKTVESLVSATSRRGRALALFRGLEMGTAAVRAALKKGELKMRERDYSSWTTEVGTTCKYLDKHSYGIVVEWDVPQENIVLDLYLWAKELSAEQTTASRLGPQHFRMFQRLRGDISDEKEVIVRDAPTSCKIVGVTSNDEEFLATLDDLGISWQTDDSGDVGYVALSDIAAHLPELGLA